MMVNNHGSSKSCSNGGNGTLPSAKMMLESCVGIEKLALLDDAVLDYVVSIVDDTIATASATDDNGNDDGDAVDTLVPFLSECCDDEEVAEQAVRSLMKMIRDTHRVHSHNKDASGVSEASRTQPEAKSAVTMSGAMTGSSLISSSISLPDDDIRLLRGSSGDINSSSIGSGVSRSFSTKKDERKLAKKKERDLDRLRKQTADALARMTHERAEEEEAQDSVGRSIGGGGRSGDIHLSNINVSVSGRELINMDESICLARGRRYGFVGQNGTGKTSLLRAIACGEVKASCGGGGVHVLHVEQEVEADAERNVLDVVLAANRELARLLKEEKACMAEIEKATAAICVDNINNGKNTDTVEKEARSGSSSMADARLLAVYESLALIESDSLIVSARAILCGLGFSDEMQMMKTSEFSGGWRMRVAIARALFVKPDLLMLDEPTNHLDLHATLWLEDYLTGNSPSKGGSGMDVGGGRSSVVIVVSHSRGFLNEVSTDMLHLTGKKIELYKGSDFDGFQSTRIERMRRRQKEAEAQDVRRKQVQDFVDKFRYNAKRASLVQSRIKMLERMADVEYFEMNKEYVFRFPDPGSKLNAPIISLQDVVFGYSSNKILFSGLNLGIDMDSRIAIVGNNGVGKTTLLHLIRGELEPREGMITISPHVRIATFSQHHVDGLDLSLSSLEYMIQSFPASDGLKNEERLRGHLSSFGIDAELAQQKIYTLSGGQKSRVALAKVTYTKPHILLLDEPSNHLDIEAIDALIKGLMEFDGGVFLISHDEYLITNVVDELLVIEDQKASIFRGDFKDYKKKLRNQYN